MLCSAIGYNSFSSQCPGKRGESQHLGFALSGTSPFPQWKDTGRRGASYYLHTISSDMSHRYVIISPVVWVQAEESDFYSSDTAICNKAPKGKNLSQKVSKPEYEAKWYDTIFSSCMMIPLTFNWVCILQSESHMYAGPIYDTLYLRELNKTSLIVANLSELFKLVWTHNHTYCPKPMFDRQYFSYRQG